MKPTKQREKERLKKNAAPPNNAATGAKKSRSRTPVTHVPKSGPTTIVIDDEIPSTSQQGDEACESGTEDSCSGTGKPPEKCLHFQLEILISTYYSFKKCFI